MTTLTSPSPLSAAQLESKIYGCWMGKSIGGTLGLPCEGRTERMSYSFYDPVPTIAPPNDDLELQLVWLRIVEKGGASLTRRDFADAWLKYLHYMWDEYGRCRWNLRRNVPVDALGAFENHFASGMGSPIRSEIWACLFPGDPASAAYYAALDASLDHDIEGIYGEAFFAIVQSLAATGTNLTNAISTAWQQLPTDNESARAISLVITQHQRSLPAWQTRDLLLAQHDNDNFTHAPLNVALAVWALLYGNGDFETSILLAVNAGYDTDSTAATVGATIGLALGIENLPAKWMQPIGDGVYLGPGVINLEEAPTTLKELTQRVAAQVGKLAPKSWSDLDWSNTAAQVDLRSLPGTITMRPTGMTVDLPWANGELPQSVKQSGGAEWIWNKSTAEPREIICLARSGAKLFIDDQLIVDCPAHLPYVPATHRSPKGSRVRADLGAGTYRVRVELNSHSGDQEASVILAYPNLHICPWTAQELPHAALLPA